jgi:RNA polymerase sigma-70 factor (ECF subfamily)
MGPVDREIVLRAQQGDRDAFARIASEAIGASDRLARLITRDPDLARDAVQNALVRAWRDLPTLRDPALLEPWLRRITVRCCFDELRRQRGRRAIEVELTEIHHPRVEDSAASAADREALERAFKRLGAEDRALVVMHYYLGLALPEAADALGIPLGTAKSRLSRGRAALRAALDADARGASVPLEGLA